VATWESNNNNSYSIDRKPAEDDEDNDDDDDGGGVGGGGDDEGEGLGMSISYSSSLSGTQISVHNDENHGQRSLPSQQIQSSPILAPQGNALLFSSHDFQ
jgi:hypothetical protein